MADWPYSTAAWQRLRRLKLSETPLCETCALRGRKVIAEAVDHIVSIASGGDAFPLLDGLRSLCTPCHSTKTNAIDRRGGKGVAIKGCDVNGLPLDPDHPFMGEVSPSRGIYPLAGRGVPDLGPAGGSKTELVRRFDGGSLPGPGDAVPREWGV